MTDHFFLLSNVVPLLFLRINTGVSSFPKYEI